MQFYRCIKPNWAKKFKANGSPNPDFVKEIEGKNVIEGCNFSQEFLDKLNTNGYNVYYFPNHPSTNVYASDGVRSLSGKHIDTFNYIYVDMDLKDGEYASKEEFFAELSQFPLKPTRTIDSGNGVHAYWKVKDLNRETFILMQRALIKKLRTDKSVWTVLQLMRDHRFFNTKVHGNFKKPEIVSELTSGTEYSSEELPFNLLNLLTKEDEQKVVAHIDRLEGRSPSFLNDEDLRGIDDLPPRFLELLDSDSQINQLFNDPKSYGDRSAADFKLGHLLFSKKLDVKEIATVLANTQKALERGDHRIAYANTTVEKIFSERPKFGIKSVSEYLKANKDKILEPQVYGPAYLDYAVLNNPWRKKELLGLIAGSGVGKTSFALNIIKETIQNNPNSDEVYIFFSLEMTAGQIIHRWLSLVGEDSPLADRLYVVDSDNSLDEDGNPLEIGLQEIYQISQEVVQCTGKSLGAIIIDHFHIISTRIDTKVKKGVPTFGISSIGDTGYGTEQNLTLNVLATQLKNLVKMLNTFAIVLCQTTKEKGQGDVPINKDGAYGVSNFDWIMDYIVTIWQPLMRVHDLLPERFLAFQYSKIREKHSDDKITDYSPRLLTFDMSSGSLRTSDEREYSVFQEYKPLADEARKNAKDNKGINYAIQLDISELSDSLERIYGTKVKFGE